MRKAATQNLSYNLFLLRCWKCPAYIVILQAEFLKNFAGRDILALLFYSFEFMTDFLNIFANFGKAFFRQLCLTAVS